MDCVGTSLAFQLAGGPQLKIEVKSDRGTATIRLIGHFHSEHVGELTTQVRGNGPLIVLDLREITLVDVEVVRFLEGCKAAGVTIVNSPQYIREWMDREREFHSEASENEH
jgi:glutathione synthase/RimK-type ligase-like ATP-grasp enzyme